jgi:hypothetical protein
MLFSLGAVLLGPSWPPLKKSPAGRPAAKDDLLLVEGWIVKRSQLTRCMQNGRAIGDL